MKSKIISGLKIIIPLLLGAYLVWYFFDNMDASGKKYFNIALRKADYRWIFLSLILSFIAFLSRAYRWKYMLEPMGYKTKFWNRYHSLMIGYIINLTIPRAGEASRSVMLHRSEGVPFSKSFGTIVAERAIDFVFLIIIASISAVIGIEDFKNIYLSIKNEFSGSVTEDNSNTIKLIIVSFLVLSFVAILILLKRKPEIKTKLINFLKDIFAGVFSIFKCKNPISYLFHSIFIWVLYVFYFGICFYSLEETKDFPLSGILLGFVAGSLGVIFTNGGIGAVPILIGIVVEFVLKDKVPEARAIGNALGMITWISQTLILIVLGLISLILLPKKYDKEDVEN
jgi:uncharacterized protein (TIRG00374 family)